MLDGFSAVTYALCKKYTNGAIQSIVESFSEGMHFQGSVATKDDLPDNPEKGDLYIIRDAGVKVVYDGNEWVEFEQNFYTKAEVDAKLREVESKIPSTANYATKQALLEEINRAKSRENEIASSIPKKTSQLTNDSGFLTKHQDISGKADKSYVDSKLNQKQDKLTAGTGITIEGNVISANGGTGTVKSVNGELPDVNGNVSLSVQAPLNVDESLVLDNNDLSVKISSHSGNSLKVFKPEDISRELVSYEIITPDGSSPLVEIIDIDIDLLISKTNPSNPQNPVMIERYFPSHWSYKVANFPAGSRRTVNSLADIGISCRYLTNNEDDLYGTKINVYWNEHGSEDPGLYVHVPSTLSSFNNDAGFLTEHQSLANYYTKDEVYDADEVDDLLDEKQHVLTAGNNITIIDNVISAIGGGSSGKIGRTFTTDITVGHLASGTRINENDTIADILYRILHEVSPEGVSLFYGALDDLPTDVSDLAEIRGLDKSTLLTQGYVQHVDAGNPLTDENQWVVFAIPKEDGIRIKKIHNEGAELFDVPFTTYETATYHITSYLDAKQYDEDLGGKNYILEFEENQ